MEVDFNALGGDVFSLGEFEDAVGKGKKKVLAKPNIKIWEM